jgi:hypothetical protein
MYVHSQSMWQNVKLRTSGWEAKKLHEHWSKQKKTFQYDLHTYVGYMDLNVYLGTYTSVSAHFILFTYNVQLYVFTYNFLLIKIGIFFKYASVPT